MLFFDKLQSLSAELKPLMTEAFNIAFANQRHHGDLLLMISHAHRDPMTERNMTGPGFNGLVMQSQMSFISKYRRVSYPDEATFLQELKDNPNNAPLEEWSIHQDLFAYQKMWEMSLFQKQIDQLGRLMNSEPYNWEQLPHDTTRNIEKAFNLIKVKCPSLYDWIHGVYDNKLRNAIAHSDYFIDNSSKGIVFFDRGKRYKYLTFAEWGLLIHKTLLFQNTVAELMGEYSGIYDIEAKANGGHVMIQVPNVTLVDRALGYHRAKSEWVDYEALINSGITP